MQYKLYSKNLEITDVIKNYLDKKFSKVEELHPKIINFAIDLSRDSKHHTGPVFRAEVNLKIPGKFIRVAENDFDILSAIDKVKDVLLIQIKKHKEKIIDKKQSN